MNSYETGKNPLEDFYNENKKDPKFTDEIMDEFIKQVMDKFVHYGLDANKGRYHLSKPTSSCDKSLALPNRVFNYEDKYRVIFLFVPADLSSKILQGIVKQTKAAAVFCIRPKDVVYTHGYALNCLDILTDIRCISPEMVKEADITINKVIKLLDLDQKVKIDQFIANRGMSYKVTKKSDSEIIIHLDYFGTLFLNVHITQSAKDKYDFNMRIVNHKTGKSYSDSVLAALGDLLEQFGTTSIISHVVDEYFKIEETFQVELEEDTSDDTIIRADC